MSPSMFVFILRGFLMGDVFDYFGMKYQQEYGTYLFRDENLPEGCKFPAFFFLLSSKKSLADSFTHTPILSGWLA